jgi:hypothetical protein
LPSIVHETVRNIVVAEITGRRIRYKEYKVLYDMNPVCCVGYRIRLP